MKKPKRGTIRYSDLGGVLDAAWNWYMNEILNAQEHTSNVKIFTKDEYTQTELQQLRCQ